MLWLVLLGGAVAGRILLATLRRNPQSPFNRALLFEFSVRRHASDHLPSRRDRLWTGVARLLSSTIVLAPGVGLMAWADRFPNLSTTNQVLSGVGFVLVIVGVLVALSGIVELVRAPFAAPNVPAREA
jgi:hypothetical protein